MNTGNVTRSDQYANYDTEMWRGPIHVRSPNPPHNATHILYRRVFFQTGSAVVDVTNRLIQDVL